MQSKAWNRKHLRSVRALKWSSEQNPITKNLKVLFHFTTTNTIIFWLILIHRQVHTKSWYIICDTGMFVIVTECIVWAKPHIEVPQTKHTTQSSTAGKEQLIVAIFGLTLAERAVNYPLLDSAQLTVHGKHL